MRLKMRPRNVISWPIIVSVFYVGFVASLNVGCNTFDTEQMIASVLPPPKVKNEEVAMHRRRFQQDRISADFRWLLANATRTGMTPKDVGEVLGERGEIVMNDTWIKSSGGHYRASDEVYKWGPDDKGKSVYLVFREDRLVNFDPSEFRD